MKTMLQPSSQHETSSHRIRQHRTEHRTATCLMRGDWESKRRNAGGVLVATLFWEQGLATDGG